MFGPVKQDQRKKQVLLQFVALLNEQEIAAACELLTPSFLMSDDWGAQIAGRDNFLIAMEAFTALAKPKIELTSILPHGEELLVRGYIRTAQPGIGSESFWRIGFESGAISRIEVTRRNSEMTLPRFYRENLANRTGGE